MQYDILLKNAYLVDYATNEEKLTDIAVKDGKVAKIDTDIDNGLCENIHDLNGAMTMPGIIDPHMHASAWLGGKTGHKMLAMAGVTTALDMSGPGESVFKIAKEFGTGLNIATIEYVRPEHTVKTNNPDKAEISALLDKVLKQGSIGIKLLGGHYPLTPEATARCIAISEDKNAYTAFHAGTTEHGSNLEGFLEAVELSEGHRLHLAHINAYCRGTIKPYMEETEIAVKTLTDNPNIISEAYLSPLNGTSAEIVNGLPGSHVTRNCLKTGGYEVNEAGMEKAIYDGWAQVNYPYAGETVLITGAKAVEYWRKRGTDTTVSFAVNPVEPRVRLAVAKRPNGAFAVDCISTDGGGIPRNVIIPMGMALVDLGALSLKEFVQKTSYNAAMLLGLTNKGSLAEGRDADITVMDRKKRKALMSLVSGKICMYKGCVIGTGAKIVTTAAGADNIKSYGLEPVIIDLEKRNFAR